MRTEDLELSSGIPSQPLHMKLFERDRADTLLVFMPSAVDLNNANRHPSFSRWKWADHFPESHVVALADPSMGLHSSLRGAWYMHPDIDVLANMAVAVADLGIRLGVRHTVAYGSSLGGFGALSLAALMPNASAIAEVPQLDFGRWLPSAIAAVERHVLGSPLEEHRQRHPERISVRDRMLSTGRIPEYTIVTNTLDRGFQEQVEFQQWVTEAAEPADRVGMHELLIVDSVVGHGAMAFADAERIIRSKL